MADLLNMERINGLPQLFVRFVGDKDWWWPLYDIDVETGMMRIDVCGKLDAKHFGEVAAIRDEDGYQHEPDSFYLEGS